jgi:hypothetical protein
MITLDISPEQYARLVESLDEPVRKQVSSALTRQPFSIYLNETGMPSIAVVANVSDKVFTNKNESYCPFEVEEFI